MYGSSEFRHRHRQIATNTRKDTLGEREGEIERGHVTCGGVPYLVHHLFEYSTLRGRGRRPAEWTETEERERERDREREGETERERETEREGKIMKE